MKKILVMIDMQNDFITGPLGNDDCRDAVKGCVDLIRYGGFDTIFFTRDTHQENYLETLEGQKLPVKHCIEGTDGWQIIPEIQNLMPLPDVKCRIIDKPTFGSIPDFIFHRNETLPDSIFKWIDANTTRITDWYEPVEIHFAGVCTSICVLSNMAICRAYFPNTRIVLHKNATGDVSEENKQAAFVCAKAIQCEIED